jgi:hypothetical protein
LNILVQYLFFCLILIDVIIIVKGLDYLLNVIKLRKYIYPFSFDPNNMSQIINRSYDEFKKDIIDDYRQSIPHHNCINKKKG